MNAVIAGFAERVRQAAAQKRPLRLKGGGSKDFYGGPLAGEILDTRAYAGIVSYDPTELVVTARAGTPLRELETLLAGQGQMLAFEPPHFGDGATVGGVVASGLSGPRRATSGSVRDFVLGVKLMDGRGEVLNFGGQVMKNVAGYDVSRLMPGSMGSLALLLEASVKILPKPAATATLRCQISQEKALRILNEWAGQPLPLSASCWIGNASGDGQLTIRLAGAAAAIKAAIPLMSPVVTASEVDPQSAEKFWKDLREHQLSSLENLAADQTLYRLALPAACGPLTIPGADNEIILEWHGQQRWIKAPGDEATFTLIKQLATSHGGHATRFKQGANVDSAFQRFTLLSEQAHSKALEVVQARLRSAFDPAGVFATKRLP